MRRSTPLLIAACALSLLSACDDSKKTGGATKPAAKSTTKTDGAKKKGSEFVAGSKADGFTAALAADPETFDTAKMSGAPEGRIAFNIFEGLYMPGVTTEGISADKLVVPGVAESHTISPDGKTWTFKLRKDAKWSDGKAITAEDFVYSWKRILTPKFPADYVEFFYLIEGAKAFNKEGGSWDAVGIKAKSPSELEVKLVQPTPYFVELVAFYTFFPTPKQAVEKHKNDWTKPENIVTNGPFTIASYKAQQQIVLEKSKTYWDAKAVKLDKATFRIIPDGNARVNAYKTGQLHWLGAGLPVAQSTSALMNPDYLEEPMLGTYYFRVNVSKESPLKDPRVRKALSLSIDRAAIVEETLSGLHEVATSYVPANMSGYDSKVELKTDIKAAKAMLAEAGFGKDKPLPAMSLLYNTDENHKLVAESLQKMWKDSLGLEIKLVNKEWKTYLGDIDTLSYEIARAGWIGDYNDPMTFLEMFTSGNGNNDTGWKDTKYDTMIESARKESDSAKRTKLLQEAEAYLLDQGPIIPVYFYNTHTLRSRFIDGYKPHNRDVHLLKYMSLKK